MRYLGIIVAGAVIWWLFLRKKPALGNGVISAGPDDFDPTTADQLSGTPTGDVTIGDEWSASFTTGTGNWADAYRSHANETDDPILQHINAQGGT